MAKEATYIQEGKVIDYLAGADIAVGDVVPLGTTKIGIAVTDIANGATGAVAVTGVYQIAASTSVAMSVGDVVYWDVADGNLNATSTDNIKAGIVVEAKLQAGATAKVLIG